MATTTLCPQRLKETQEGAEQWLGDGKLYPGCRMTEAEFVEWCDDVTRAEWVDGEVIMILQQFEHDEVHFGLKSGMGLCRSNRSGIVKGDNFQVRLPGQRRRRTPDLIFISKERLGIVKSFATVRPI
jgi:hypothetical protein